MPWLYLAGLGVDAEGCLEQVIHLFGDFHIQSGVGKGKEDLLSCPQQLLLARPVSTLRVQHLSLAYTLQGTD